MESSRRFTLLGGLCAVVAIAESGCSAPSGSQGPVVDTPPAGQSVPVVLVPVGSHWKVRVTEVPGSVREEERTLIELQFDGRSAYGIQGALSTTIVTKDTFNEIGTIRDGKIATRTDPEWKSFSSPLWIGKTWDTNNSFVDVQRGVTFFNQSRRMRVAAFEDVTVPAGTFKAFRIESGQFTDASESKYWYAPSIKLVVKTVSQRHANHYLGVGNTTTELLTVPT